MDLQIGPLQILQHLRLHLNWILCQDWLLICWHVSEMSCTFDCIHLYELVNWTPKLDTYSSSLNCEKVKMIRNRSKVLWRTILLMHTPHNVHTCTLYNYASFQNSTFLHYKWMRCLTALQARKIGSIKTLKKIPIKTQVVIRTPVPTYAHIVAT